MKRNLYFLFYIPVTFSSFCYYAVVNFLTCNIVCPLLCRFHYFLNMVGSTTNLTTLLFVMISFMADKSSLYFSILLPVGVRYLFVRLGDT